MDDRVENVGACEGELAFDRLNLSVLHTAIRTVQRAVQVHGVIRSGRLRRLIEIPCADQIELTELKSSPRLS